eukprot:gene7072-795_t
MNSLDRLELLVDDVNSKWRQYQLQRRAQEHGEVNGSGEVKNSGAAKVAAVEGNAAAGGGPGKQLQPPSIIAPDVIGGAILSTPPPATPEQWKDTAAHTPKEGSGFDCDDEDSDVMTHTPQGFNYSNRGRTHGTAAAAADAGDNINGSSSSQEPPSSAGSAATTPASSGVALKFESDGEPPVTPLDKVKAGKSSNRPILDQPAAAVGKQWPVAAAACAAAANASKATAEEVVAAAASAGAAAGPTMPMSAATAALHAQAQHDLG